MAGVEETATGPPRRISWVGLARTHKSFDGEMTMGGKPLPFEILVAGISRQIDKDSRRRRKDEYPTHEYIE